MNATTLARFALTVGPVQYHWPRQTLFDFYAALENSQAETVVLGEAVCSRRRELKIEDWLSLARDLKSAGKEVVLVTQTLIESEADLRRVRRLVAQQEFLIEAGDASALQLLSGSAAFVLGPHINIYNRPALTEHVRLGATRWVAPAEVSLEAIAKINPPTDPVHAQNGTAISTEAFVFGRLPLAFSARCFTARHYGLSKDACEFRCLDHPDGLLISSSEGQPFLAINGTQTQSAAQHCLIAGAAALHAAGVSRLRLSPCSQGFTDVLDAFDRVMNHGAPVSEALPVLEATGVPGGLRNGFAYGRPGMEWVA